MKRFCKFCLLVLLACKLFAPTSYSQVHKKVLALAPTAQTIVLDSSAIYTPSFHFSRTTSFRDTLTFRKSDYLLDSTTNVFQWIKVPTELNPVEEMIDGIMENFEWKRVQEVMDYLDWQWRGECVTVKMLK